MAGKGHQVGAAWRLLLSAWAASLEEIQLSSLRAGQWLWLSQTHSLLGRSTAAVSYQAIDCSIWCCRIINLSARARVCVYTVQTDRETKDTHSVFNLTKFTSDLPDSRCNGLPLRSNEINCPLALPKALSSNVSILLYARFLRLNR